MSMPETGPALQTLLTIQDILRKLPTAKPCRCYLEKSMAEDQGRCVNDPYMIWAATIHPNSTPAATCFLDKKTFH